MLLAMPTVPTSAGGEGRRPDRHWPSGPGFPGGTEQAVGDPPGKATRKFCWLQGAGDGRFGRAKCFAGTEREAERERGAGHGHDSGESSHPRLPGRHQPGPPAHLSACSAGKNVASRDSRAGRCQGREATDEQGNTAAKPDSDRGHEAAGERATAWVRGHGLPRRHSQSVAQEDDRGLR